MSLFSYIHNFITLTLKPEKEKESKQAAYGVTAQKILTYLFDLINDKDMVQGIRKQYEAIIATPVQEQETALLALYFDLEDFILKQL